MGLNGQRFDAVLVGAGIVGSSAAMGLAERGLKVAVVGVALSGRLSSSEKNVRATWRQPVNIALRLASIRYFETFSGRGVMQSYGAGQAVAELIADGRYGRFDASALSRERFSTGALMREELHI